MHNYEQLINEVNAELENGKLKCEERDYGNGIALKYITRIGNENYHRIYSAAKMPTDTLKNEVMEFAMESDEWGKKF